MLEKGKWYFFQNKGGTILHGKFKYETPAWYIFELESGKEYWLESYSPTFQTLEELKTVKGIVQEIYKETYVPNVVHIPNRFTK